MSDTRIPVVLCLSGHDPSGGAGIQADIEAVRAQGAHPATVITALTVQDSRNVYAFEPIDSFKLIAQAGLLLEDMPVSAIKIGMLGSAENAKVIARLLEAHPKIPVVLDPVLRAGGGVVLADQPLIDALLELLLPKTWLLTPNAAEVRLLGAPATTDDSCVRTLLGYGVRHVLVTGGDEAGEEVVNTLHSRNGSHSWRWPRLSQRFHGSGCTLAAAIAGQLAKGATMEAAVESAQAYTWRTLESAYALGRGQFFPLRSA